MKYFIISVFLNLSIIASATDYYVSNSGNDKNNGTAPTSPWQSIARVNAVFPNLKPGDRILFRRGDLFTGTLNIAVSGSPDSPITIGAFGKGDKPSLSGFIRLTCWKMEGNGIFSKVVSVESAPCIVTIDDKQYAMGRYPNSSYLIYESHKANASITDDQLTGYPDWTGAEVVINKQNWLLEKDLITRQSLNTIEYNGDPAGNNPEDNRGYFIQNDIRTLDTFGEWFYNKSESKIYLWLGNIDPEKKTIKIASVNNLIYNYAKNSITIDGLSLEGSNQDGVRLVWGNDCTVRNCSVKFSGQSGLDIRGKNNLIDANDISWSNLAGIYVEGANSRITQNLVQNTGLFPGATLKGNIGEGIFAGGDNSFIEYNTIINCGGMGIRAGSGWITRIKNNYVNTFLLVVNDGGGIYIDGKLDSTRIVEGNIIINGSGKSVGKSPSACGIYLDEYSCNVVVKGNTVAFNPYGINLHRANSNTIVNNLAFGNGIQIAMHNTSFLPTIYRNNISNNIFFSLGKSDLTLFFRSITDDIFHFGKAGDNYYARPLDDDKTIFTFSPLTGNRYRTLSGWQSFTHQDASSHKSPFAVSDTADICFYYNASRQPRTIPLKKKMVDVEGEKYNTTVTLKPFTSIVLMKDPNQ